MENAVDPKPTRPVAPHAASDRAGLWFITQYFPGIRLPPMHETPREAVPAPGGWKRRLGLGLLAYSVVPICTIEFIAMLPLSAAQIVTFGAIYIASGEIACFAAVALLGRPFIEGVKQRIKDFFRRSRQPSPPKPIGKLRHYTGVTLLVASIAPYYMVLGVFLFSSPGPSQSRGLLYLLLTGEGLFFLGLLVLGGEFWARLKKLFEWPGKETSTTGGSGLDPGRT